MVKKQWNTCQLALWLFYDTAGSTASNQVLWYNWLFTCFMILFPSSCICFRRVMDLNLGASCPLVLSKGHSEVFWVWQHYWLFWLVVCGIKWDCPLPAPWVCCSSKHLVVSMGCTYWQDTWGAVLKRGRRLETMHSLLLVFTQVLHLNNGGNVGLCSMILDSEAVKLWYRKNWDFLTIVYMKQLLKHFPQLCK